MKKQLNTHVLASPRAFVDQIIERLDLKNDAQLARMLGLQPSTVCKMRQGKLPLTAEVMLRIHDAGEVPMREIRSMARVSQPDYPEWDSVVNKHYGHSLH